MYRLNIVLYQVVIDLKLIIIVYDFSVEVVVMTHLAAESSVMRSSAQGYTQLFDKVQQCKARANT